MWYNILRKNYIAKGDDIMDVGVLTQLIGSLGFPIAMCVALLWIVVKLNEQHKSEMDKMTEALNNNTIALTKLASKLGVDDQ